jgi:hypothetical protein
MHQQRDEINGIIFLKKISGCHQQHAREVKKKSI